MKTRSSRSLKATTEGIKRANKAILNFATKIELAVEIEVSRATVQNFFAGKPIDRENFHRICEKLGLPWQEIAELPENYLVSTKQETTFKSEVNTDNEIWRKIQADIQHKHGIIRALDMSYPRPLQEIYTNINVLKSISSRR
jgi:transcriptional regulator with XRE-family HTH domain